MKMKILKRKPLGIDWKANTVKKKTYKIEKALTSLLFSTHFQTVVYLQSLLSLGSTALKVFFPDNTSSIAHLYGCAMAEL